MTNNNTPLVSVVMSVFNAEKYLREAVESILNQTYKNFEFIIIEDCSTDNSLSIIDDFSKKDNRIKLIKKNENKKMKGFIENLNIGLKEAKGKYIARMDADDISFPERFEKQVNFLENNPDVFIVGSAINFIDENRIFSRKLEALEHDNEIKNRMPTAISMYHPVIMFRNNGITHYREKIYYCEDYDLYLRLMTEGKKFYNFTFPLLNYRILKNSISRGDGAILKTFFVEKVKQFYDERRKSKKDSYDFFDPENLRSILDKEKKHNREDLIFAMKSSLKYDYKDTFLNLYQIYKSNFKCNFQVLFYKFLSYCPALIRKLFFKLF